MRSSKSPTSSIPGTMKPVATSPTSSPPVATPPSAGSTSSPVSASSPATSPSSPVKVKSPAPQPPKSHPVTLQPAITAQSPSSPSAPPCNESDGLLPPSTTYPSGLQCLMNLDYLFLNQNLGSLQSFAGWDVDNKYVSVMTAKNETIFYVAEESGVCGRVFLDNYRSCEFIIFDRDHHEVLRMIRPFRFHNCCCPCYLQVLEIYSGNTLLGSVTQEWSLWRPKFFIRDASGTPVMKLLGPIIYFWAGVTFKVKSMDSKHRIGRIQKTLGGISSKDSTIDLSNDKFTISFPHDLDVKIKAILLGACFLMDFMCFDRVD
ncbi:phospholipid scramblase family member 5-like [Pseudomyrmex gracilis]|uniref:phospholipid scramblase family member 5-like n=1 Tax=Pseudomyrmex gracilis TaxID=219809 RepID=UPI0009959FF3|nr:phospholipid scramblase family member 5-like [Pseudomyrmex gracilis]XP_020282787.1 phospholipid scramblase family member 5-like [Pseudomyrmex gracilis]XP_020282788.1 phospholipid scramblase family member 5-like [Pseudomyrmex gracilis]